MVPFLHNIFRILEAYPFIVRAIVTLRAGGPGPSLFLDQTVVNTYFVTFPLFEVKIAKNTLVQNGKFSAISVFDDRMPMYMVPACYQTSHTSRILVKS